MEAATPPSSYRRTVTDVTDSSATPAVGAVLDERYRLDGVLGRGGYATVFRARDLHLDRDVAVKVFAAAAADTTDAARVASETRLLASLTHPSLVTLFDAHLESTPAYLVMELIDGPTLAARIARGPLSPGDTAVLAGELGEALHVIHDRGIVHRDIKPSNVLLRPSAIPTAPPRATLADFGIASLVDSAKVTVTGTLVGTAAYLSPEQARGERAGTPTDVYALGLVLLEALTGRRAYPQATPHEALAARLVAPPRIPDEVPADWRGLLSAMTALEPAHRPDAHAVVRAADRLRSPSPSPLADATDRTRVLPPADAAPTAQTKVLPSAGPAAPPAARRLPRWVPIALIVAAVVVLGCIATALVAPTLAASSPDPAPTLPALPAPFDDHFRQLLDEVQE